MENDFNHLNITPPTYDSDCELIDICEELGATYNLCYKGSNSLSRCKPAQKQSILQWYEQKKLQLKIQDLEDERLLREEKLQSLRDKKAVRLSWIQLLVAAILGSLFTKLFDLFPLIIEWLKVLLSK